MGQAAIPLAMMGSSVASGLLSPQPDQLGSFENTEADPTSWLGNIRNIIAPLLQTAIQRAEVPVDLPAPDFKLPSFSGGGLPMPIGIVKGGAKGAAPKRIPPMLPTRPSWSPSAPPSGFGAGGIVPPTTTPAGTNTTPLPAPTAPSPPSGGGGSSGGDTGQTVPDTQMPLMFGKSLFGGFGGSGKGDPRAAARLLLMAAGAQA